MPRTMRHTIHEIVPHEFTLSFESVTLDHEGRVLARPSAAARGLALPLAPGVTMELVALPGGAFLMGSPEGEGFSDERPRHAVSLPPFWLGRYPVTQAQWEAVMGPHRSRCPGPDLPVDRVSWHEAAAFCGRIAVRGDRLRLPSEAEWEYACRAGTETPFHCGPTLSTAVANYNGAFHYGKGPEGVYRHTSTAGGAFPDNAWGLGDMHGGLWEWCADAWHPSYAGAPTDGSVWDDGAPRAARVARGGSWHEPPEMCRSATRLKALPAHGDDLIGFRVAWIGAASPGGRQGRRAARLPTAISVHAILSREPVR